MLMRGVQHLLQKRQQQFTCSALLRVQKHASLSPAYVPKKLGNEYPTRYRLEQKLLLQQRYSTSSSGSGSGKDDPVDGEKKLEGIEITSEDLALTTAPVAPKPAIIQKKHLEVKTVKGILTITTTIEDSKINEIVFEKSDVAPVAKLKEPEAPIAFMSSTDGTQEEEKITIKTTAPSKKKTEKDEKDEKAPEENEDRESSKPLPIKRPRFDYRSSLERNFVTPGRAMLDFMLTSKDLESLPKIKRRSPYEQEPPMTVYWRRDVEAKALEVWGSRENLLRERLKREVDRKQHQQNLFTVKRRLRDYRREMGSRTQVWMENNKTVGKSSEVVATAIAINAANFLFKVGGWLYSGSHSMFAECIHSLADLINQLILAFGIYKSSQRPDTDHPYGYMNMRYVSSLISGVGIFCMGCGLSIYHGIDGIMNPEPITDLFWVYCILMGSLVSEGATLVVAINELKRAARLNDMTFKDYVLLGKDPCVNVVLCEDAAAVAGVIVAGTCMALSSYTGSPTFDAVGSLIIGGLLGSVASFIIYTNANALVGVSIPIDRLEKINAALESDVMIRAIYDVKGIDIGNARVRYKAELDFDGRELTRSYLDKMDLAKLLTTVRSFRNVEELEAFLLDQGENIVDLMGGEIDRIEMNLRKNFPEIRHCDLEIL